MLVRSRRGWDRLLFPNRGREREREKWEIEKKKRKEKSFIVAVYCLFRSWGVFLHRNARVLASYQVGLALYSELGHHDSGSVPVALFSFFFYL